MSRTVIEQMLYLLDQAFEPGEIHAHALLTNLIPVDDREWLWRPPNGERSIVGIAEHVGECKFMYANHAFGDAQMSWHDFDARNSSLPQKDEMIGVAARRASPVPGLRRGA